MTNRELTLFNQFFRSWYLDHNCHSQYCGCTDTIVEAKEIINTNRERLKKEFDAQV